MNQITIKPFATSNLGSLSSLLSSVFPGFQLIHSPSSESILNVIPGVGNFENAIRELNVSGVSLMNDFSHQFTLGICLGFHLLCQSSDEASSDCEGYSVFPLKVLSLRDLSTDRPIHTGWSQVTFLSDEFSSLSGFYYFSHSYGVPWSPDDTNILAVYTFNGRKYVAAYYKNNFLGLQFHPETSGSKGRLLLKTILNHLGGIAA